MGEQLAAALDYAARGWRVLPTNAQKRPLTEHGLLESTADADTIAAWWRRWQDALVAVATGESSGFIALDIDVRTEGSGLDTLEELGICTHPATATAHTPSGGIHCLFRHPGREIRNSAGKLGRFLDVRGDGGYIVVPPGPGRYWDPHLGPDTPLAPMPAWMVIGEPEAQHQPRPVRSTVRLGRYGEAALSRAVRAILDAGAGQQRATLNREAFSIGQLVEAGEIPASLAINELTWAAGQVRSLDGRRPWHAGECKKIAMAAYLDGQASPRRDLRHG